MENYLRGLAPSGVLYQQPGALANPPPQGILERIFLSNARALPYASPPPVMAGNYMTKLSPLQEMAFQQWVKQNNVPFNPSPTADYDMRGFYQAMMNRDPRASSGIDPNDGRMHFTDYFKTPTHPSFSAESKWATNGAPSWNENDQLIDKLGKVIYDAGQQGLIDRIFGGR